VRLPKGELKLLKSIGKLASGNPRSSCNVFAVLEAIKNRRRGITEPLLNDYIFDSDLPNLTLPSKQFIRQRMSTAKFFVQLDAKAYFDQFGLSEEVAGFFGVGDLLLQRTLPMGFRPSCHIAQRISERLLDMGISEVLVAAYIDNFLFWSDDLQQLRKAVDTFLERCRLAGILINEGWIFLS